MLAVEHRLNDPDLFRTVSRRGRRAGSRTVVVHLLPPPEEQVCGAPARVGLVVSRAVGSAVVRNRVKRRLRHLARDRVGALQRGTVVVLRAREEAATASASELGADLDRCLHRALADGRVDGREG